MKNKKSYENQFFWIILSKIEKIEILEIATNANCLFLVIKGDVERKKFCVFINYFIDPFVIPLTTHF